jgi:branched-chain amino acid transport system permease protein
MALALLAAVLISTPWWLELAWLRLLTEGLCVLALAQMWNLLAGYTGLPSMGQQAFVGLGAYALVVFGLLAQWPLAAIVPAAALAGALLAVPAAALLFRLRGPYFAVGSWVVAEVFRLVVAAIPQVSGGSGISIAPLLTPFDPEDRSAWLLWSSAALGVGATAAVWGLLRSRWGLALRAVRDSEVAAETLGVRVSRVRWWVWVGCASFTSAVGAVLFLTKLRVSPDAAFSIEWTTLMLFAVVVGGIGTPWGPIVGVLIYFGLREWLGDLGSAYMVVLGLVIIAAVLWMPRGVLGWLPAWRAVKPGQRRAQ